MKTIYSKNHILRNSKTELYGGKLVKPFERPERMEFIINEIETRKLGPILEPTKTNTDITVSYTHLTLPTILLV